MSGIPDFLTFHVAATVLTALVLGGMVFFAAVFAPLVFAKLPAETAGGFIRQVFPVYYRVMGFVSLAAALPIWYRIDAWIMGGVGVVFLFLWAVLLPVINAARDSGAPGERRFNLLHRLSVLINLCQMIAVLVVFLRLVR